MRFKYYKKAHYKTTMQLKENYYINEKTHLSTEQKFVVHHLLKINKQGVLISSEGWKKLKT